MGVMKSAFGAVTGVFDGIGDRLSIAHISNQIAKQSTGATGFVGKTVAWAEESIKSTANLATLGLVRNLENGVKHKDIVAMDDMSKSERTELISDKVADVADRRYEQVMEIQDAAYDKVKAKHEDYSK